MEHLTSLGSGRDDRVVTQHPRVAVAGTVFLFAVDFTDRRVDIDHEAPTGGPGACAPRPAQRLTDDAVELPDAAEREGPQKRAERRRGHHPERQHRLGRTRTEHVRMIDMGTAGKDRRDEGADLAAGTGAADPAVETHRRVHQRFETEPHHQRRRHDQARVRDQRVVVEGHVQPVDRARYSTHRNCLLELVT